LVDAPSSFINHPTEMLETAGAGLAAAAPFAIPELLGAGSAAASDIGGFFGGGAADALTGGGSDALAFDAVAPATNSSQSAISALLGNETAAGGTGADSFYTATGLNPSMVDANAFSTGNQLAGVGGGNLGGLGGDVTPIASGTSYAGDVGAGGDAIDAVAGAGGKGAGGSTGFWDNLVSGAKGVPNAAVNSVLKNPLGVGIGAAALGYNMLNNKTNPNIPALQGQANQLSAQGQQFMQYLQTGTLPPSLKAAVDQAANAAKATIIANHARNGQSTDPTQNSALAQELAAADQNALIAVGQLGEQLFTAGQSEIGLSSQIYTKLIQIDQQQSASTGKAIANFAAALGSGSRAA
jgi:hypothetical protein